MLSESKNISRIIYSCVLLVAAEFAEWQEVLVYMEIIIYRYEWKSMVLKAAVLHYINKLW